MSLNYESLVEKLSTEETPSTTTLSELSYYDFPKFIGFCSAKNLPLDLWAKMAIGLYDLGRIKEFLDLLKFLIDEQMEKFCYNDQSSFSKTKKISIINFLAVYYLCLAACENEKSKKEELFDTFRIYLNKSDRINLNESSSFALKGFLYFFQGDFSQSLVYFNQNEDCVVAILGKAILEFANKNYEESLKLYKKALKLNPELPAQARLGFAYNFLCLNKIDMAFYTFQRILKMDPNNIDAILGLSVLEFRQENYEKYYEHIERAYELNANSPFLLLQIAQNLHVRGEFEKARLAAIKGYKILKGTPKFIVLPAERIKRRNDYFEAKSRFLYIIGFYQHVNSKIELAGKYYEEAVQAFPQNLNAQYGLGQICIYQKNFGKALKCFETINENSAEKNEEILKILGYLLTKNGKRQEAIEFYKKALKFDPYDHESWIEYASLQEQFDLSQSLYAYEKALEVLQTIEGDIKPEIYNNIGVLNMRLENYDQALISFNKALEMSLSSDEPRLDNGSAKYLQYTIQFNMGILFEESNRLKEANECYKKIIIMNPFYTDAYLRLAFMAFKRGSYIKALEYTENALKKVEQLKKTRPDLVLCLKGYIYQEIGDFTNARAAFESIKRKYSLEDPFADLSNMKIFYEESCELRDQPSEQKKYLKTLIEMSKHVLNYEEVNYQASMILGIVMGEFSHFGEAKEIFNQIEYRQQNLNILINIAHLEFLKGNFENAIKIYESYLQKTPYPDEYIEMCLVVNNYLLKKNEEALKIMKKIILRNPENLVHRYNLNVLLHDISGGVLEQRFRQKDQTLKAITNFNKILPIYEYLFRGHYARKTREDLERCDDAKRRTHKIMEKLRDSSDNKFNFIKSHQSRFESFLKEDEEQIQRKKISLDERKKILQELKEKELAEKRLKEEQELVIKLERERIAREEMEEAQKIADNWRKTNQEIAEIMVNKKDSRKNKREKKNRKKGETFDDEENSAANSPYSEEEKELDIEPYLKSGSGGEDKSSIVHSSPPSPKLNVLDQLERDRKQLKKRKLSDAESFEEEKPNKKRKLIKNKKFESEDEFDNEDGDGEEEGKKDYDPLTAGGGGELEQELDDFAIPAEKEEEPAGKKEENKDEPKPQNPDEEEENML